MPTYTFPTVDDFKNYFNRDFPYGTDIETSISDQDINKAFQQSNLQINSNLCPDQSFFTLAYLLLSAHYLVEDIRASSQGIMGQYNFMQTSKGAAGVSESFGIPDEILKDPNFNMYCKTNYGKKYLAMMLPRIRGAMFSVRGYTHP